MKTTPPPAPDARPRPPLVLAGHGTRDAAGVAVAHALVERVRRLLPDVRVEAGFVELTPPRIEDALATVLADDDRAVVVPLMIGAGGHVRDDIPDSIEAGRRARPGASIAYTRHLGAPAALVDAARQRIDAARGEWAASDTAVVFVGRGCSVTSANADHVRLGRVLYETGGYASVVSAFIQVVSPTVAEGLAAAANNGATRIVVMPHFLFPGRLETWVNEQAGAWASEHSGVEVRVADVLGDCDELAGVIAQRYKEGSLSVRATLSDPAYLSGLLLAGRRVVAVGGGCVNRRRVPTLLRAGARVTIVAPELHPALAELANSGEVTWEARGYEASDLDGAWYVLAATDSPETNARIAADAEARHTFCVRADAAEGGSAYTPATADFDGAQIAVLGGRDPRRSKTLRDRIIDSLRRMS